MYRKKNENYKKLKFAIYARKSSEAEDKQVQSIEDQMEIFEKMARDLEITIVKTFGESKSAKDPYQRPEFEKLMQLIEDGEIDGILTWKLNRLARNPVDGGRVQWLLQKSKLKSIITNGKEYTPQDNTLIFSIETGISTQYVIDLSIDVKRGQNKKFKKGIHHGRAPTGYLNTKTEARGENYIIKDPERFDLIKRAWKLMVTGKYTGEEVRHKLNEEWGYRSLVRKKIGGVKMTKGGIYRIFTNDFYAGMIHSNGESKIGIHEPMITLTEFEKVQYILGRKTQPKQQTHDYAYNGVVTCGECGGFITATTKPKYRKDGSLSKIYTLYYCSNSRKKNHTCSQKTFTNVEVIEKEIENIINKIVIDKDLKDVLLKYIELENEDEIKERNTILKNQQSTLNALQRENDNLNRMRMKDMIDDDWFKKEKERIKIDIIKSREELKLTEKRIDTWDLLAVSGMNFAHTVKESFESPETTLNGKKMILSTIGLNSSLKDKKLSVLKPKWLELVEKNRDSLQKELIALEPPKDYIKQGKTSTSVLASSVLRNRRDSNPRPLA